jgi:hypothetical protein
MPKWETTVTFTREGPRGGDVRDSAIERHTALTPEEGAFAAVENVRETYSGDIWNVRVKNTRLVGGKVPKNTPRYKAERAKWKATLKTMLQW